MPKEEKMDCKPLYSLSDNDGDDSMEDDPDWDLGAEQEGDVSQEDRQKAVTYTLIQGGSKKGCDILVSSDGYCYTRIKTRGGWKCSASKKKLKNGRKVSVGCNVYLLQVNSTFFSESMKHNHPPKRNIFEHIFLRFQMSKMAVFKTRKEVKHMFKEVIGNKINPGVSRYKNLMSFWCSFSRFGTSNARNDPEDLEFEVDEDYLTKNTSESFLRCDLKDGGRRHFIFATDKQLKVLAKAKLWVFSSTTKLSTHLFCQLLVVHVIGISQEEKGKNKNIQTFPCAFVLMSHKKKKDYQTVLLALLELLPVQLCVKEWIIGYDVNLVKALKYIQSDIAIRIDLFSWWNTLDDKLKNAGLKIKEPEEERVGNTRIRMPLEESDAHIVLKKIFALPFLPQNKIACVFQDLSGAVGHDQKIVAILDFFREFWIENKVWSGVLLSVVGKWLYFDLKYDEWLRKYTTGVPMHMKRFYILVPRLFMQVLSEKFNFKMISEIPLKKCKGSWMCENLNLLWNQYELDDFNLDTLASECSSIFCRRYFRCHL